MFWNHLGYNFQIWTWLSLVNYCNSALRETTPTLATYHVHCLCNDLIAAYGYSHFHRFNCRRLWSDSFVPLFRHASPVLAAINYRRRCGWLADVAARGVRLFSYCACVMAGLRLANATGQCAYQCYVHAHLDSWWGLYGVMYTTLTLMSLQIFFTDLTDCIGEQHHDLYKVWSYYVCILTNRRRISDLSISSTCITRLCITTIFHTAQ